MLFELRQYQCISGKRDEFAAYMDETLIPFQVSQGVVVVASFIDEEDPDGYVWIRRFDSREEQSEFLVRYLSALQTRGEALRGVCIVARTTGERDAIKQHLNAQDVEVELIERDTADDGAQAGVRLATMHRVKGLEFDRVVMASMNEGLVPLSAAIESSSDDTARESAETEERSLVYVAATRAKKELLVLSYGVPSPLFLSPG